VNLTDPKVTVIKRFAFFPEKAPFLYREKNWPVFMTPGIFSFRAPIMNPAVRVAYDGQSGFLDAGGALVVGRPATGQ